MRILPHITDRDMELPQETITAIQRGDLDLLQGFADAFLEQAQSVASQAGAPVVVMCNVGTDVVQPSPLDWDGKANVLGLEPSVYSSAKRALESADPAREAVVLLFHPDEEILSIYTVSPEPESEDQE